MALCRKPPYIPTMRIAIVKGQGRDHINVTRSDGSRSAIAAMTADWQKGRLDLEWTMPA